jgi:hypothetical protein
VAEAFLLKNCESSFKKKAGEGAKATHTQRRKSSLSVSEKSDLSLPLKNTKLWSGGRGFFVKKLRKQF